MTDYAEMRNAMRRVNERRRDLRLPCQRPGCEGRLRSVESAIVCPDCMGGTIVW